MFSPRENRAERRPDEVQMAADLYLDNEYRHVLNALLLANANDEQVSASLNVPESVQASIAICFLTVRLSRTTSHEPATSKSLPARSNSSSYIN
jgi:hypothetical protein